ncbi:MAG: TraB/GumN family protein [Pseudomonadota bacterium]
MRLLTFLATFLLAPAAWAQTPPACTGQDLYAQLKTQNPALAQTMVQEAATQPYGKGIYFSVSKPGVAPSIVMGTVHITDPRIADLPPAVEKALNGADVVALEITEQLFPQKAAALTMQNMGKLFYTDGTTLTDKLSEADGEAVKKAALAMGMPWSTTSKIRPFFLMAMMSLPACERARDAAGLPGLDDKLGKQALKAGKSVVGLENFVGQLEAVNALPEKMMLDVLVEWANMSASADDVLETMVQFYLNGETGMLWSMMNRLTPQGFSEQSQLAKNAAFQRIMLDKRNVTMADGSAKLIDAGNAFIAVGALHLPGEKGLLNLLAQRGYTIKRIQ